jgi:hypothetical protein
VGNWADWPDAKSNVQGRWWDQRILALSFEGTKNGGAASVCRKPRQKKAGPPIQGSAGRALPVSDCNKSLVGSGKTDLIVLSALQDRE